MYISIDEEYLSEKLNIPYHLEIKSIEYNEVEGHFHINMRRKQ